MCWECSGKSYHQKKVDTENSHRVCQKCDNLVSKKAYSQKIRKCVRCRSEGICARCSKNQVKSNSDIDICKFCRSQLCIMHFRDLWPTQDQKWQQEINDMHESECIDSRIILKRG